MQRCPLSLPLYVGQGEITKTNINKNIKGIKIPNNTKEIKILQYANDSNFFLTEQKSVKNVLHFFKN